MSQISVNTNSRATWLLLAKLSVTREYSSPPIRLRFGVRPAAICKFLRVLITDSLERAFFSRPLYGLYLCHTRSSFICVYASCV